MNDAFSKSINPEALGSSIEHVLPKITPGVVLGRELETHLTNTEYGESIEYQEHQEKTLKAIIDALKEGQSKGYVELATSTGKTYIMSRIVDAAAALGMRSLVLAPTKKIADQIYGESGEKGLGRFTNLVADDKVGRRYGKVRNYKKYDTVISTYQSMNWFSNNDSIDDFDLIIGDEAHMSLGQVTSKNMDAYCPNAIKIGFTATPAYSSERSVDKIWGGAIAKLDLQEAIRTGLTPAVRSLVYQTGMYIETIDPNRTEFTQDELNQLVAVKQRNDAVIAFTKNFVSDGQQGTVACLPGADHAHARFIAEELSETSITIDGVSRMISAASVGSHQDDEVNQSILEAYDRKEIDVLTFVKALELGWDSQRPQFMINAAPTTSIVRASQLLGRLLRGEEDVTFVDFLDDSQKRQVLSLHVLGEMTIDSERRVGGNQSGRGGGRGPLSGYLGYMFEADIYRRLAAIDGKTLSDIYFNESQSEDAQLQRQYDEILRKEGLPAELPPGLIIVPDVARRALDIAVHALGKDAHLEEITDYAIENDLLKSKTTVISHVRELVAAAYGNDAIESISDYDITVDVDPQLHAFETTLRDNTINALLDSLSEREAGVIRMRFGLGYDTPKSLDEIGYAFGVSRERVRQIESKTMAMLRRPSRANTIREDPPEFADPIFADISTDALKTFAKHRDKDWANRLLGKLLLEQKNGKRAAQRDIYNPDFTEKDEHENRTLYAQTHLRMTQNLEGKNNINIPAMQRAVYLRGYLSELINVEYRARLEDREEPQDEALHD